MKAYSPKEYWSGVAENSCADDPSGLAPILYPDSPPWFNQLIDDLQFRAIRRAITLAGLSADTRILDVGCGTGRWLRRYQQFGFRATGVDATAAMLRLARERGTAAALTVGEANRLPFRDATFDAVTDITVTQHIPQPLQVPALAEMIRVIRPGGCLILMELIQGEDKHIFPRTPQGWIEGVSSCGAKLIGWFGQEYLLIDRLFVRVARTLATRNVGSASQDAQSQVSSHRRSTITGRIYWGLRHITVPIAAWSDPAIEMICPARVATHGVFVFRK
jgi:SAM-dependent methyltransferase